MRTVVGWAVVVIGVLVGVLGAAVAVVVGPDSTVTGDPHRITSEGSVVATAPDALRYFGPTVEITVVGDAADSRVFVGVGRDLDVADYLDDVAHTEITDVSMQWDVEADDVTGSRSLDTDPSELDWWLASDSGEGEASISLPLPDSTVDVVAMDPDLAAPFAAEVTVGVVQHGAFAGGIAGGLLGIGLGVFGWLARKPS